MAKKKSTKAPEAPETAAAQPTSPETVDAAAEESATLRLSKPEDPNKAVVDEEPAHETLESLPPAPTLSDPINRDKEATGEMRAVKSQQTTLEDDPPVIHESRTTTTTVAPDPRADHGTMTPQKTPSASEIVANAQRKAAEIVEDRVNMSGSVRQAKSARYEAIQETKATNKAFEKAADEVGSVVDKLAGNMDVMDFLLDKELNSYTDVLNTPDAQSSTTAPASTAPQTTSTSTEPEWKRKASELYEQKRQQEQDIIVRRRAQNEQVSANKAAQDEQMKAGRMALEARMREERAAAEARLKADREAVDAQRRAEQERLRAERAAMDARLKEEREAKDAERRASKKLGRDD